MSCNYDRHTARDPVPGAQKSPTQVDEDQSVNGRSTDTLNYPESKKRRLLELRLLHHYTTKTSLTLSLTAPGSAEASLMEPWNSDVPNLAFDNDALLNIICAISALHTVKCNPRDLETIDAYRNYLNFALREHSNDVAHLTKMNADAACLSSSLIRVAAFAVLQERPLVPYTPPMQWLQMTKGAGNVFNEAWKFIGEDDTSIALRMVMRTPVLKDPEALFQESRRQDLLHLLHRTQTEHMHEAWSAEIDEAYASTLSYIGSAKSAINGGEKPQTVCRVLMLFPYLIKRSFIDLIEEQRPRALVILAHYFGLLAHFKHIWFIGDTGSREIRAIQTVLSEEWQELMTWPLQMLAEGSSSAEKSWS